jgi:hypothetical protein
LVALLGWVLFRPFAATDAPVRPNLSFEGLTGEGNPPAPSPRSSPQMADGLVFMLRAN